MWRQEARDWRAAVHVSRVASTTSIVAIDPNFDRSVEGKYKSVECVIRGNVGTTYAKVKDVWRKVEQLLAFQELGLKTSKL